MKDLMLGLLATVLLLGSFPVYAGCDPTATVCIGQACDQLGQTRMDKNGRNILGCVYNASNALVWESFTPKIQNISCPSGQFVSGFNTEGAPVCGTPASSSSGGSGLSCTNYWGPCGSDGAWDTCVRCCYGGACF